MRGQQVLVLENDDLKASLRQAAAAVEKAEAEVIVEQATVENARANVASAVADVAGARADLLSLKAKKEDAARHLARMTRLYQDESIARETYDSALTSFDVAQAETNSAKARIDAALAHEIAGRAQLRMAESQILASEAAVKTAKADLLFRRAKLDETVISSPIAGIVVNRLMEAGETTNAGATVLTLVDPASLYIRVDLEETMVSKLTLGSEATIRVEGLDRVFQGKVVEIGRYGEFATQRDVIRGRLDIKTFKVKIAATDPDDLLKPGMTVDVSIKDTTHDTEEHRR